MENDINGAFWEGFSEGLKVTPEEKKIAEQAIAREKRLRKLRKRAAVYGYAIRRYKNGYDLIPLEFAETDSITAKPLAVIGQELAKFERTLGLQNDEWDAQDDEDD